MHAFVVLGLVFPAIMQNTSTWSLF